MNFILFIAVFALLGSRVHSLEKSSYEKISGRECFRSYNGMIQSMKDLADMYPHLITINTIGESYIKKYGTSGMNNITKYNVTYELPPGYDILAFNITASNSTRQSPDKGKMLIVSRVHAREWATAELNGRFIETLVEGYEIDPDITWILERNEVHGIIYVNPDGSFLAEKYPRSMWRKNLNPVGCDTGSGSGVDINRNFDFMWGQTIGSSSDPCKLTYHGPSPNSEPETQALVNYARKLFPEGQRKKDPEKQKDEAFGEGISGYYVDIHAFGKELYYPWGFANQTGPDDEAFQALGRKIHYYNGYKLWSSGQPHYRYPVTGVASDYMYSNMGVASMIYEIGSKFHQPCAEFEEEIVPNNLRSFLYAASIAQKPFSLVKGPDMLELDVKHVNGELRVSATASDGKLVNAVKNSFEVFNNSSDYPTGNQSIQAVRLYLDQHPDDWQKGDKRWDMDVIDGVWDTNEESVSLAVSTKDLPAGKHIVYVQAIDSLGYVGPASSAFVNFVQESTPNGSSSPTSAHTHFPTVEQVSSFRRATKGCTRIHEQVDLCLANDHTSNIAVNCCSGSQQNGDLICSRNGCKQTMSYDEATAHCKSISMRLCTTAELEAQVCCGKGCYFNKLPAWTSDVCNAW
ncbi:hypothetical protein ACHAWC_007767 [Mediolabrus comicus]